VGKITFAELASAPSQRKRKEITVEEWGGNTFYIVEISALDYRQATAQIIKSGTRDKQGNAVPGMEGLQGAIWLSFLIEDHEGKRPPVEWLEAQPMNLLIDLCAKALEFNGLSDKGKADLEKNSGIPESAPSIE
jgi:hypothetical protein